MKMKEQIIPFTFTPDLTVDDPFAVYWLRQVTIRLRREISWLWHEQGRAPGDDGEEGSVYSDKAVKALYLQRTWERKQHFYSADPTARYLTEQLAENKPGEENNVTQGSFGWVCGALALRDVEAFVLAMGLLPFFDNATGSVIAACLNDPVKTRPTLSLAQALWDYPEEVLAVASPAHPLFHYGLLHVQANDFSLHSIDWDTSLGVPPLAARQLLFPGDTAWADVCFINTDEPPRTLSRAARLVAVRLEQEQTTGARIVPLHGPPGAACEEAACAVSSIRKRRVVSFCGDPVLLKNPSYLNELAALCWLNTIDLFFDQEQVKVISGKNEGIELSELPRISIPIVMYLAVTDPKQLTTLPARYLLPRVEIDPLTYRERLAEWYKYLGNKAGGREGAIAECARRFRFQKHAIQKICRGLTGSLPGSRGELEDTLSEEALFEACRGELNLDIGDLARRVVPRFDEEELILPPRQAKQFSEIIHAMQSLTEVHYEWGTEKPWNESGISVLFAGPPGTGKTMAAEILALRLHLPMYRIDLSQVASKYIGETEKNLKHLFDRADISDTILFFDEADALYGKRTEVKDAHDRYANLEISYLLERMERFKGLAILATNRKKDLDEAFLRRLRYIIDFPMPGEKERQRIWRQMIPRYVDSSLLDIDFLAKQFKLAGGYIRSIIFNACLQSTHREHTPGHGQVNHPAGTTGQTTPGVLSGGDEFKGRLTMEKVIIAVKREFDKLDRTVSLEQFGPYGHIVKGLEEKRNVY
jgi:hypothetical protein